VRKKTLGILVSLLVVSFIPFAFFVVVDYPRAEGYIAELLTGHARISFDVARNWFDIYSTVYFGSIRFSLTYVVLLLVCFVVFCTCLALIARNLYFSFKKKKR
jgi:xanthine/uracil permease